MWDLPRPGLEPVSPVLAGRFLTTAPPGKAPPPRSLSGVLFLHPSGERSKAPSLLSQGPPRSKPSSLPLQWCNSVLPLRNPHSYIIRYSPRPAGPKLLKFKKAAFILLDTSSLRQNPSDSITCFSHQYPSRGVHWESPGRFLFEHLSSRSQK